MANEKKSKLNNFYIRAMAKGLIRQNYGACMGSMAILMALTLVFGQLEQYYGQGATDSLRSLAAGLLIAVLSLLVMSPANVGARSVFCDLASGRKGKGTKTLSWYGDGKRISRSVLLMLMETLMALVVMVFFGGLALAVVYQVDPLFFSALLSGNLFLLTFSLNKLYLFLLAVLVPAYLVLVRFVPAAYLLAGQPEKSAWACLKESPKMLKGFYWKYVGLQMLSLLQLLGYALMASVVSALIFGGNVLSAAAAASVFTEIVAYFTVLPQLGVSTALFINDALVLNGMMELPQESPFDLPE